MSKKDYQAIAAALYNIRTGTEDIAGIWALDRVVQDLAEIMAEGNPRFDRARFREACETGKCKGMRPVAA